MTVLLATSRRLPPEAYGRWACIGTAPPAGLDPARAAPDVAAALEAAFDAIAADWAALGRTLSEEASAGLAHAPACASNASDMGLMMAWAHLVERWAGEPETVLVVCDDPWMFRHLATIPGVAADRRPGLAGRALALALRGAAGRLRVTLRALAATLILRRGRSRLPVGAPALLVYGHPESSADGEDAYFGSLMAELPALVRLLHVDCPPGRARRLAGPRTASLHGWGRPLATLSLPFARWRPPARHRRGAHGWLVRRAAALEGGTGQGAMIRWQQICHGAWLRTVRPMVVAWPWENHAWERDFVRRARALGVRTVGYQHATIGAREWNYAPASNPDGLDSIPDRILASGPMGARLLRELGYAADRIETGGALRLRGFGTLPYDPAAPVFVALPFDQRVAAEMVAALRPLAANGRRFLVRDHPMTPFAFDETPGIARCDRPLQTQDGLSAVIYAGTSVGLEAALGGLPTLRFRPGSAVPVDAMPESLMVPTATAETLAEALDDLVRPARIGVESVFARPALEVWRSALYAGAAA